jgi:hypothetical protein
MKTHANQPAFACALCKQTFVQRRRLVSHSNKVHGGNLVEEEISKGEQVDPSASYSLVLEGGGLVDLGESDGGLGGSVGQEVGGQHRLVDFIGQDGVSIGQTIVLIQVPEEKNSEEVG